MADNTQAIGGLIGLFIIALIGIVLLSAIGDSVSLTTETLSITNRSIDISSARLADNGIDNGTAFTLLSTGQRITGISEVRAGNGSVLIEDTDWFTNSSSIVAFSNSTTMIALINNSLANITLVDFGFEPAEFVKDANARTFLGLIPLFFVIGLLLFIIAQLNLFGFRDMFGK